MSSSPFRDELHALQSALSELQNENSELRAALSRQEKELEAMRAQTPENIGPVMRRLQEENAELRARVAELEPQLAQYAYERRMQRNIDPLKGTRDAIGRMLEGLFGRK
jgi:predicted  nucleic acid-binding Zn-ribbon protein